MAFKIVISKREKTFQKEIKDEQAKALIGLKIGNVFEGRLVGEPGKLRITGGSDKEGFPMRKDVEGTRRLLLLLDEKPGYHPLSKGERRRKRVRGNTISEAIIQINTVLVEEKKEEPKVKTEVKETKPEIKEEVKPKAKVEVKEAEKVEEEKIAPEIKEEEKEEKEPAKEEKPKKKPAKKKEPSEKKKTAEKKPAAKKTVKKVSK